MDRGNEGGGSGLWTASVHVQIVEDGVALFVCVLFFFLRISLMCADCVCLYPSVPIYATLDQQRLQFQRWIHLIKTKRNAGAGAEWNGGKIQAMKKECRSHAARLLCPATLGTLVLGAPPSLLGERNTGITLVDYTGGVTGAGAGRPQPGPAVIMFI